MNAEQQAAERFFNMLKAGAEALTTAYKADMSDEAILRSMNTAKNAIMETLGIDSVKAANYVRMMNHIAMKAINGENMYTREEMDIITRRAFED